MKRRLVSTRAGAAALLLALVGCGGGEAEPSAAVPAETGDALRGKLLWNTQVADVGLACIDCHGQPSQNLDNVLNGAAGWELISRTIQTNASMRPFLGKLSGYDMQDLSAYLRNPLL